MSTRRSSLLPAFLCLSLQISARCKPLPLTLKNGGWGRRYAGMVVCEFVLADEPVGAGGLAIVPGSHKSSLPFPRSISRMEKHEQAVVEVSSKAGDVSRLGVLACEVVVGTAEWRAMYCMALCDGVSWPYHVISIRSSYLQRRLATGGYKTHAVIFAYGSYLHALV